MKQGHVGILLVNWNSKEDTEECLQSLEKLNTSLVRVSIIVIDNDSKVSVSDLATTYKNVTVTRLSENKGFTGGNNEGMKQAMMMGCDTIWMVNNDTKVHPNALDALYSELQVSKTGIVGSKIYFSPGHEYHKDRYNKSEQGKVIWYAGGFIDWDNLYGSHRGVDEVDHGQYDEVIETDFVTGCSLMVSKACLDTIGLFDDRYFAYLEDMDFSMRAKMNGYTVKYVPSSIVWHKNAGSTGGAGNQTHQYYMTRNRILFGLRYASARTKFALIRESFRLARHGTKAQKKAIIDAAKGQWGKRLETI
jgi:hypothetical protein